MKASCIGVFRSLRMNQMSINHIGRCFTRSFFWENICSVENISLAKQISFGGIKIASAFLPSERGHEKGTQETAENLSS